MPRIRRPLTLALITILALIYVYYAYQNHKYLPRRLGLSSLPSSVDIEDTYVASWTDYYHDWLISLSPDDYAKLISGRDFVKIESSQPRAVYFTETGAHYPYEMQNGSPLNSRIPVSQKPIFEVGEEFCEGHWQDAGQICVFFSKSRDRALITFNAD